MIAKIIGYTSFILLALKASGQVGETVLSKQSILVGEKITLTYKIAFPKKSNYTYQAENSIIPSRMKSKTGILATSISSEIEILSPFHDTVIDSKNGSLWIGTYEITAWDSGSFVLSESKFILNDSTYFFPSAQLNVDLVSAIKGQDIYDIKESFAEIPDEPFSIKTFTKNNWWWMLLLVLIPLVIWMYFRHKRANLPIEKPKILSLKNRVLLAIDALEKERLWEKELLKQHFIELSFILRSYLSSRYEINLLEKTTFEARLLLQQKGLHEETIQLIITVLSASDMVKFAKSKPEEFEILKISQFARQVIAETSPIEFDHAE